MKQCRSKDCAENNPQSYNRFIKDKRYADGHQNRCKSCQKKYGAARYTRNKQRILRQSKSYYSNNLESSRKKRSEWRENHREYSKEYGKLYRQLNPGKELAKCRRYQASKLNAVPPWLTKAQVEELSKVYETCPKGYEVDHVVPLQGKGVCGLHVPWNLQHLPRAENRRKGNKY